MFGRLLCHRGGISPFNSNNRTENLENLTDTAELEQDNVEHYFY